MAKIEIEHKGVKYDVSNYDDVVIWQEKGQQCYLSRLGVPDWDSGSIPCDNHAEAVEFQAKFHAVMPRLHYTGGGGVEVGPISGGQPIPSQK